MHHDDMAWTAECGCLLEIDYQYWTGEGIEIEAIRITDDAYARYFYGRQEVGFFARQAAGLQAGWAKATGADGGKYTAREFRIEVGSLLLDPAEQVRPLVGRRVWRQIIDALGREAVQHFEDVGAAAADWRVEAARSAQPD